MEVAFWLEGLVIGFSIAAPVGPISVLCIRRTLAEGRIVGFVSGVGAATADALYGCVAGCGLTTVSDFLVGQQMWLRIFGGVFLCYLGLKTLLAEPVGRAAATREGGVVSAYTSMLFLTLTNPMTILSFAAAFAGLGLAGAGRGWAPAGELVLGVFSGSALWWLALSVGTGVFRERLNSQGLRWVNRISGSVVTLFGLFAILSVAL